jgi:hypothetical protein
MTIKHDATYILVLLDDNVKALFFLVVNFLYLQDQKYMQHSSNKSTFYKKKLLLWCTQFQEQHMLKMTAFWDMAPCSLVKADQHFRDANCLHHQGDDGDSTHF